MPRTALCLVLLLAMVCLASADVADPRPLAEIAPASTYVTPPLPPGQLSDRVVSYSIKATLDPAADQKTVTGTERLTWRNPSDVPVSELQFHLYLNAFRDDKSSFMKESGGQLRGDEFEEGGYGNIEVTSMKTAAGEDLLPQLEFIHPDDDNANDRTVARVPLATPVAPGATIELAIDFKDKMPKIFARTGYHDNYFLVGQWYPKIGVFEPRGMRGRAEPGWNCHQFHANSEFYADFGTFDVEITAPADFVVGATGELVDTSPAANGMSTRHFKQDDVHDFAWVADDKMLDGHRTYSEQGFQTVEIRALVQPEHAATMDRQLDIAEKSIRWFNENIGPYPYKTLTVVDPEEGAMGSGGMEYPTFITGGFMSTSPGTAPGPRDPMLETVIFHEYGHQYWYGMVGSNEFEEAWMDEGINTYTETLGMAQVWPDHDRLYFAFGGRNICEIPLPSLDSGRYNRVGALPGTTRRGPMINASWKFKGDYGYGENAYRRPGIALMTLEGYLGRETMQRVMRTYFDRWKFRHPTSQDFFDVASEVSGQDLTGFFDQYFRADRVLDYAIQSVKPVGEDKLTTEFIIQRNGDAVLPVHAVVTREDGSTAEFNWDGAASQQLFTVDSASPIVRVVIDPENKVWLDANITNNSWVRNTARSGSARIATQIGLLFEHILVVLSGAV